MMKENIKGIHVDKDQTSTYRDMYNEPCECGACDMFREKFATQYSDLVTYLRQFGIDIDYPLEVMDFSTDEKGTVVRQYMVYYCVKGKLPVDKMNEKIGDVDLTLRNWNIADEAYAQTGMKPPYFIIELELTIACNHIKS